jgi:hypothetical protein
MLSWLSKDKIKILKIGIVSKAVGSCMIIILIYLGSKIHVPIHSPTLNSAICLWLALLELKTLWEEKSVIVELGKSQPRFVST